MQFGLHYLLSCAPHQSAEQRYRDTLLQAIHSESMGFESVWPVEQHFNRELSVLPCPALLLAAIAARTRRLRLGTGIVQLPLTHPLRVAEEIATLDVISGGRVELGVGRGGNPTHYRGFGVSADESRERFIESLEVIRGALSTDHFTFRGKFFGVDDVSLAPKPVQRPHPAIRIAANSLETAQFAGRAGYPVLLATNINPLPKLRPLIAAYQAARLEAQYGAATPNDLTLLMPVFVGESASVVRAKVEPGIKHYAKLAASLASTTLAHCSSETERQALAATLERLRGLTYEQVESSIGVFGSPAACVERLAQIREEWNPGRVICWFNFGGVTAHGDVLRSMEQFAAQVMPHFAPAPNVATRVTRPDLSPAPLFAL